MPDYLSLTTRTDALKRLRWPLRLTRLGMGAEAITRAFWPLWSLLFLGLGTLALGAATELPLRTAQIAAGLWLFASLVALVWGVRRLTLPTEAAARDRLDRTLAGRPISALEDTAAIGANDAASMAVWKAHQSRMAARAADAKAVSPDLRLSRADPFALRYVAVLLLATGLLFGSFWRVGDVGELSSGAASAALGPSWEGWIEPPAYTGLPALYLADQTGPTIRAPEGSRVTLRFYGEAGALTLDETVSGRAPVAEEDADTAIVQDSFDVARSGALTIEGPGGQSWRLDMTPDAAPSVSITGPVEAQADGQMAQPFEARDDYGIEVGQARMTLDVERVDRRYLLAAEPEPRDAITLDLPMPITGGRAEFDETLIDNLSQHPFANLPVSIQLEVTDARGQVGLSEPMAITLPGRRFFDPMAAAVIEQRQALLWSRETAPDVAMILRAISWQPEDIFRSETAYLRLRVVLRRLETLTRYGLTEEQRDEMAQALWDLGVLLEEGDLADAQERLRRAQDRLSEAMKNGASDEEIAELMNELRDAMRDYMRQLAQNMPPPGEQDQAQQMNPDEMMELSQQDLQDMMDRIQELMEQGKMDEAQALLDQLSQMMENMQMAQGQQGQGQQSPGQQAMEGLADTLRQQQGLSDQAFRDLQEQFNPNGNQQGQAEGNEGRNGGQGRGQSHENQPGQQGQGRGQGDQQGQPGEGGSQQGQQGQQPGEQSLEGTLADRQQALRNELQRQQQAMPGVGGEAGDAARDALDRAGRAMEGAEDALRGNDLAEAIDQQAEAMDALRDGMRNLGEALAEEQRQQQGQQGQANGQSGRQQRDPLGRDAGDSGQVGTDDQMLGQEDVYRRARELLDEIRRRSGDTTRSQEELDYLRRLLDRF